MVVVEALGCSFPPCTGDVALHCSLEEEKTCLLKEESQLISLAHNRSPPTSELVLTAASCALSEREASPGDSCVTPFVQSHIH